MSDTRLNPDTLLQMITEDKHASDKGQLRIFIGMCAGVGKTYAMLKAAHQKVREGHDVIIGFIETHQRKETADLLNGLEVMPLKDFPYRGKQIPELDLEAILARKPDIVIIDELPHTNTPGSRHPKRYQDVLEILEAGIDVYTALNVQHIESRKEAVENITSIRIQETVPDSLLERASLVELVDIAPTELLKRLSEGRIYLGEKAKEAAQQFFKEDKLTALRELALRMTAERVDQDLQRLTSLRSGRAWQANERLLVAISHSPQSERLIRAARRLAYKLEAPWIALYIDTGLQLHDNDQAQLTKNLNLARELNAEVITTSDSNIASAINRIARQKNVAHVIVGKPTRSWLRNLLEGGSILRKLVRDGQDFDVHMIRNEELNLKGPKLLAEIAMYRRGETPVIYWRTFLSLLFVTILSSLLPQYVGYRAVGFIYLLAVLGVGFFGTLGSVLFAAVLSALAWDLLFIPPRFTLAIAEADDIMLCVSFFIVALITGLLTNRIRHHEQLLVDREERMSVLYQVLKAISDSNDMGDFITTARELIGRLLNGQCDVYLRNAQGELSLQNFATQDENERAVLKWAFESSKAAGWSTDTLSRASSLCLPVSGAKESIGVFVFKPERATRRLTLEQEHLLKSVVGQLGISIERHLLAQKIANTKRLEDSEKLQQTILNSISHEIRTPLTAILSASSALQIENSLPSDLKHIAQELEENSERLNRVIDNLLDMSRLSSGTLALNLDWQDPLDLVTAAQKRLAKALTGFDFKTDVALEVPLMRLDFRLFEHALTNLVLNATQYCPPGSRIVLRVISNNIHLQIIVEDNGPGIAPEYTHHIFEKFYRAPNTRPGGTGLGLSIVQSIVELHNGKIHYEPQSPHGSRFIMTLPIEAQPQTPVELKA